MMPGRLTPKAADSAQPPIACQVNANTCQHMPQRPRGSDTASHAHTFQSFTWAQVHPARAPGTVSGSDPSPFRCSLLQRCVAKDITEGEQIISFVLGRSFHSSSASFRQFGNSELVVNLCFPFTE